MRQRPRLLVADRIRWLAYPALVFGLLGLFWELFGRVALWRPYGSGGDYAVLWRYSLASR